MKVFPRNKTWWADFSVDGTRFRISLELPTDKTTQFKAERIALKKYAAAEAGKLSATRRSRSFARLNFKEAADKYLQGLKVDVSKKTGAVRTAATITKETQLLVKPREYFGLTRLNQITAEHIREYQEWRAGKKGGSVGSAILNMETGIIRRLLKRARSMGINRRPGCNP